jgi:hypothetical protein
MGFVAALIMSGLQLRGLFTRVPKHDALPRLVAERLGPLSTE